MTSPSQATESPRAAGGLRLPSVVAILVGIALFSGIAIPMWFGRPTITLNSATDLLVQDLEELRQRATYLYADVQITFEEEGDGYDLADSFGTALSAPVGPGPYFRRYQRDAVFRGVKIIRVEIEGSEGRTLGVDARGDFAHSATIEFQYKDQRRTVLIDAKDGSVEVRGEAADLVVDAG